METSRNADRNLSTGLYTTFQDGVVIQGNDKPEFCSWCALPENEDDLPAVFCWTKMEAEAGQPLGTIIARKNLERAAGNGLFFWGIGNPLGHRVPELIRRERSPQVFFSIMKSKPKPEDEKAEKVLMWTAYVGLDGRAHQLPDHTIILSRGATKHGQKSKHYALVCHSVTPISNNDRTMLDSSHVRNLGSTTERIGFSQVTAIVEHDSSKNAGLRYRVAFRANLVSPYFVRLIQPRLLSDVDQKAVAQFAKDATPNMWIAFSRRLRDVYAQSVAQRTLWPTA